MSSEQNDVQPGGSLKAYMSDISLFGLLDMHQETEAFLRLYKEEDACLRHLISRPQLAIPIIEAALARMETAKEPDAEGIAALRVAAAYIKAGKKRQAADELVRAARLSDEIRSLHRLARKDRDIRHDAVHHRWLRRADVLAARALASKNWIAACNLRLVVMWVRRHYGNRSILSMSDLIQEGNIGLLKAIDKFDVSRGNRFSTYASWWIRQAMCRAIADTSRTIRIPVHMLEKLNKLTKADARHFTKTGESIGRDECAQWIGISPEAMDTLRVSMAPALSLDAPVGTDLEGSFLDMLRGPENEESVNGADVGELRKDLDLVMKKLTPIESYVIRYRFGLDGSRPQTLSQIAERYELSRERIRQLEARALSKMRTCVLAQHLPSPPAK